MEVKQQQEECDFCKEISEAGKLSHPPELSRRGMVMLAVSGGLFAGITALLLPFVSPGLRRIALPYIPASSAQISNVLQALRGRSGSLLDIGSGDGRITLAAARHGFQASGVELNFWLVLYSRWSAWSQGLAGQANFHRRDLWKTNLSSYHNIVIFGVESMMAPLEQKLGQELKSDARIVACRFPLPSWSPLVTIGEGVDTVWIYSLPETSASHSQNDGAT